ncbi:MAG: transporter [Rikenellaceae bacterium]|nr:transporter [Rikenellaceae bacterium]
MFELLQWPYFALFVIVALGFMLGRIKIKGISLDVSAVIFVALLFGHFGVVIPGALSDFGMVLFIFTIGIQAGPGFFRSFRTKGQSLVVISVVIVAVAVLSALAMRAVFGLSQAETVGILTGALTSTPGLATAKEIAGDQTAVAYGIAYPFGVIGVILFVKLLPRLCRVDLDALESKMAATVKEEYPVIGTRTCRVERVAVIGRSIADLSLRVVTGAVISRIKHGDDYLLPTGRQVLENGDLIKAVGTEASLDKLEQLVGGRVMEDLPLGESLDLVTAILSNKSLVNVRLASLDIPSNFNCTVTRVYRAGIDLTPTPDLQLKWGDKLTIVGGKRELQELVKLIGNDAKKLSDTDFFPIALGIVLGVLFGKVTLSFGDSFTFSFGLTGGVLLTALLLSARGKTGPVVWSMSFSANQLLRQLGLLLFLAGVGTSAGTSMVSTIVSSGWSLFAAGALVTFLPMVAAAFVGVKFFKVNMFDLLGTITGGMTSTPGLAAADSMTDSPAPSVAYATVYPVAMVLLILGVQFVAMVLA